MAKTRKIHSHDPPETNQRRTKDRAITETPVSHRSRPGLNPERYGRELSSPVLLPTPPAGGGQHSNPRDKALGAQAPLHFLRAEAPCPRTGAFSRAVSGAESSQAVQCKPASASSIFISACWQAPEKEAAKFPGTEHSPCCPAELCRPEPRASLRCPARGKEGSSRGDGTQGPGQEGRGCQAVPAAPPGAVRGAEGGRGRSRRAGRRRPAAWRGRPGAERKQTPPATLRATASPRLHTALLQPHGLFPRSAHQQTGLFRRECKANRARSSGNRWVRLFVHIHFQGREQVLDWAREEAGERRDCKNSAARHQV